jgi:hypothetical protein
MGKDHENAHHSLIHLIRSDKSPEEAAEELSYSSSWAYKWWGRFNVFVHIQSFIAAQKTCNYFFTHAALSLGLKLGRGFSGSE